MRYDIRSKFNDVSQEYDRQRRQLIPCYDDFYNIATSVIDLLTDFPKVLDVGAGTGLFSSLLLNKFPKAKITLIDISDKMLDIAKQRFEGIDGFEYIVGDYSQYNFAGEYDVIISALSIHHLTDEQKRAFYNRSYSILRPNGIFINCDQVLGDTEYLDSIYKKHWKSSIEKSGLPKDKITAGYERIKLDKETPLSTQLQWLSEAGFSDVDCIYKYYHFAVMFGRKIG
ncbi:MAG: methyltransferase [Desulfosporosinus sp. BRH_c37]|nr:MAG: methyltransferase [Desulfosporosinus sp. BRH_c37]